MEKSKEEEGREEGKEYLSLAAVLQIPTSCPEGISVV